jgi:hypothetical protein
MTLAPWGAPGQPGALFVASQDMTLSLDPDQRHPDVVVQSISLPILRLPEAVNHDQ